MMLQTQFKNLRRSCLWRLTACMLCMLICLLFENRHQQTVDEGEFKGLNDVQEPQRYLFFSLEKRHSTEAQEEFRLSELKPRLWNFCH